MACRSSTMPADGVYFVKLPSSAAWAAALTCSGVGKSGSPAPRSTTSTPWRRSRSASADTRSVGDATTRLIRWANSIALPPLHAGLLQAELLLHDRRHQAFDFAAKHEHFLDQPRADVGVLLGRHHEHRLQPGGEMAVHEGH